MAFLPAQISQLRQNLSSRCVGVADQGSGLRRGSLGLPCPAWGPSGSRCGDKRRLGEETGLVINGQVSQRWSLQWAGWQLGEELHAGSQRLLSWHPGLTGFRRAISLIQQTFCAALNLLTFAVSPFRPPNEGSTTFTPTPSQRAGPGLQAPQCPPTDPELRTPWVGLSHPRAHSSGSWLPRLHRATGGQPRLVPARLGDGRRVAAAAWMPCGGWNRCLPGLERPVVTEGCRKSGWGGQAVRARGAPG